MSAYADQNHAPSLTCVRLELPRQCLMDVAKSLILLGFLDEDVDFTPLEDRIGRQDVWNDKRYVLKIRN